MMRIMSSQDIIDADSEPWHWHCTAVKSGTASSLRKASLASRPQQLCAFSSVVKLTRDNEHCNHQFQPNAILIFFFNIWIAIITEEICSHLQCHSAVYFFSCQTQIHHCFPSPDWQARQEENHSKSLICCNFLQQREPTKLGRISKQQLIHAVLSGKIPCTFWLDTGAGNKARWWETFHNSTTIALFFGIFQLLHNCPRRKEPTWARPGKIQEQETK